LLRALDERAVLRIGETQPRPVDVRIVAATNRELATEVAQGRFRPDLLYRIRVGRINLPPLRARRDDLPLLIRHALAEQRAVTGRAVDRVSHEAMQAMLAYDWPGNVRELQHTLGYAVIHCPGTTIELEDLPPEVLEHARPVGAAQDLPGDERERILAALARAGGGRKATAARRRAPRRQPSDALPADGAVRDRVARFEHHTPDAGTSSRAWRGGWERRVARRREPARAAIRPRVPRADRRVAHPQHARAAPSKSRSSPSSSPS